MNFHLQTQGIDTPIVLNVSLPNRNSRWLSDKLKSKNALKRLQRVNWQVYDKYIHESIKHHNLWCSFHLNVGPSPQSWLIPDPTETALLFLLHIYSSR